MGLTPRSLWLPDGARCRSVSKCTSTNDRRHGLKRRLLRGLRGAHQRGQACAASAVTVRAERIRRRRDDLLRITVIDNGRGGADPQSGTGLHGLSDRVEAVDGELFIHSPPGEGTVLTADIPWRA